MIIWLYKNVNISSETDNENKKRLEDTIKDEKKKFNFTIRCIPLYSIISL